MDIFDDTSATASSATSVAATNNVYSDDDGASGEEESSDFVVSSDDDDNSSDNEVDDVSATNRDDVFFHAARDIQNRTSRDGGTPLPRALRGTHGDRRPSVGDDGEGQSPPREEQAKASALDAILLEGLPSRGPRLLRCRRVGGCC